MEASGLRALDFGESEPREGTGSLALASTAIDFAPAGDCDWLPAGNE